MRELVPTCDPEGVYSVKRTCAELGVSYKTLRKYKSSGADRLFFCQSGKEPVPLFQLQPWRRCHHIHHGEGESYLHGSHRVPGQTAQYSH